MTPSNAPLRPAKERRSSTALRRFSVISPLEPPLVFTDFLGAGTATVGRRRKPSIAEKCDAPRADKYENAVARQRWLGDAREMRTRACKCNFAVQTRNYSRNYLPDHSKRKTDCYCNSTARPRATTRYTTKETCCCPRAARVVHCVIDSAAPTTQ